MHGVTMKLIKEPHSNGHGNFIYNKTF